MTTSDELAVLPFTDFMQRVKAAAERRAGWLEPLSNGAQVVHLGDGSGPTLWVVSGLHGDERSGPLAVLALLEDLDTPLVGAGFGSFSACPLLNDQGWDQGERQWGAFDLNRSFSPRIERPAFIMEIMRQMERRRPTAFIDVHEDSDVEYAYVFRNRDDPHDFQIQLAAHLDAQVEIWNSDEPWEGSSEVLARELGVVLGTTFEAPPCWPLERRVAWHLRGLRWCLDRLPAYINPA